MSEPTLAAGAAADISGGGEVSSTPEASSQQDSGNGFNPAWTPMLEKLPPEFHSMVAPDLKQWDQNFQTKLNEVQSRYAPYNDFVENQVPPETLQSALQLMAVIEADPKAFYDQMGDFYKDQWGQGQQVESNNDEFVLGGDETEFDITQHPKFQEQQRQLQIIAQHLDGQLRSQQEAEQDAALEAEETRLKEQYGEFDPVWVYSLAAQNQMPLEDAVKAYHGFINQVRQTPTASSTAPSVFAPSGAIPSTQPNPAEMSSAQTRSLVADILRQANEGN